MTGYVYFFETGDGLIKIGKANNVATRFKQIQTSCPTGLTNLGSIPSDNPFDLEKRLHKYFKKYRTSGEWFDLPTYVKKANFVHLTRLKFDDAYAAEQREIEHQRVLKDQGYLEYGKINHSSDCPECGNPSQHLEGVYLSDKDEKYTRIVTLSLCEYCDYKHGIYEDYGKGTKYQGAIRVSWIPADWKRLL